MSNLTELVRTGLAELQAEARPVDPIDLADGALRRASRYKRRTILVRATAAVVALTIIGAVGHWSLGHEPAGGSTAQPRPAPQPAVATVQDLLQRASLVAYTAPAGARPDQFYYQKYLEVGNVPTDRRYGRHEVETWIAVDGKRQGMLLVDHVPVDLGGGNFGKPFKGWPPFAQIPTDPAALVTFLEKTMVAAPNASQEVKLQAAYESLQVIIREPGAPDVLRVAAYRALGLMPGVTLVQDAQDVAGRHGIAIDWPSTACVCTFEIVFDPNIYIQLGFNTKASRDNGSVRAGSVISGDALMASGITDEAGHLPK
jgi:hypothetical protein